MQNMYEQKAKTKENEVSTYRRSRNPNGNLMRLILRETPAIEETDTLKAKSSGSTLNKFANEKEGSNVTSMYKVLLR